MLKHEHIEQLKEWAEIIVAIPYEQRLEILEMAVKLGAGSYNSECSI